MKDEIPAVIFLVRSRSVPQVAILCTEANLAKWVDKILDKGEQPMVDTLTRTQLSQILNPNPNLN